MALWQYTIIIIPKNNYLKQPSTCFDRFEYDNAKFWTKKPTQSSVFKTFDKVLPIGKSWHTTLTVYGDIEKNCIEVFEHDNGLVEEVVAKIDFRTQFSSILDCLIEFAILNSLILLDKDLCPLPLNLTQVKLEVFNSEEYKKYYEISQSSDFEF